ncbi:DUF4916 domain-containing protein [Nocardia terpenica]
MHASTELIARAIIRSGDRLLVARERTKPHVFLPGGHVKDGESVEDALVRELAEELGTTATVGNFIGAVEHRYSDDAAHTHHELNLIFAAEVSGEPHSQEEHLEFAWLPMDQVAAADLRPSALKEVIVGDPSNGFWRKSTPPHAKSS